MSIRFPEFRPRSLIRSAQHNTIVNTLFNGTVGESLALLVTGVSDAVNAAATFCNRDPTSAHLRVLASDGVTPVFEVTDAGVVGGGGAQEFNVKAFGAGGAGVTDDTAAIDAAVAAAAAHLNGGVVYFPSGRYLYQTAGIFNNPGPGINHSLTLRGDGIGSTNLVFTDTSATGTPCIDLRSQSPFASAGNYGNTVQDMSIDVLGAKPVIKLTQLEAWRLTGLTIQGGTVAVEIAECRFGWMEHCNVFDWTDTGIKITGVNFASNYFHDLKLNGSVAATGWAFDYLSSGSSDAGGIALREVGSTVAGAGGFRFSNPVLRNMFIFMERCVVDTQYMPGPGLLMQGVQYAMVEGCWFANFTPPANGGPQPTVVLDGVSQYAQTGGFVYGGYAGAPAFSFKNGCGNVSLAGVRVHGVAGSYAYFTDGTLHTNVRIDNPPPVAGMLYSNDASGLAPADSKLDTPNFVLSAGWGAGRSVTNVVGDADGMQFQINAGTSGFSASPTLTINLPPAVRPRAPIVMLQVIAGNAAPSGVSIGSTTSQILITFGITPAAGNILAYALFTK